MIRFVEMIVHDDPPTRMFGWLNTTTDTLISGRSGDQMWPDMEAFEADYDGGLPESRFRDLFPEKWATVIVDLPDEEDGPMPAPLF